MRGLPIDDTGHDAILLRSRLQLAMMMDELGQMIPPNTLPCKVRWYLKGSSRGVITGRTTLRWPVTINQQYLT